MKDFGPSSNFLSRATFFVVSHPGRGTCDTAQLCEMMRIWRAEIARNALFSNCFQYRWMIETTLLALSDAKCKSVCPKFPVPNLSQCMPTTQGTKSGETTKFGEIRFTPSCPRHVRRCKVTLGQAPKKGEGLQTHKVPMTKKSNRLP